MSTSPTPDDASPRLGYLLKHAALRYAELTSAELAPLRITPQEWAALNCLGGQQGHSQKEVAELLGIDRTSMVALIDQLQAKGWVERKPHPDDRRKNAVTLTKSGRGMLRDGARVIDDCERRFLATLSDTAAGQMKSALYRVITANE